MPVDDAVIDTTIDDLLVKIAANRAARKILEDIYTAATSIQKIVNPSDRQGPKIIPNDPMLGGGIEIVRRQAIFDKVVSDHTKL